MRRDPMAMPEDMCMCMYLGRIGSQQPRGHSLSFRLRLCLPCRRLMAALPSDLGRPPLLPPRPQPAPPLDLLFTDPPITWGGHRCCLLSPHLQLSFAIASRCHPSTTSTNTMWALSLGKCGQRIDQRCRRITWAIFEGG